MVEMDLEIPSGLTDLLQDFTVHVLRDKPEDIVDFAASYFMKLKLKEKRKDGKAPKKTARGVSFRSEANDEEEDESDDEEPGSIVATGFCSPAKLNFTVPLKAKVIQLFNRNQPSACDSFL